ncbi:MAG: HAD-IA family hydrolase [Betaproteobacteria bacterium]|nr:HAD-IA family hydrolase [Betaproteobacteria bacterium]
MVQKYDAVLFDLLTALLDSWTIWNQAAGSKEMGRKWRAEYLRRTYGCGAYRPYETLVMESAKAVGLSAANAANLEVLWPMLMPWPGVIDTLTTLRKTHRIGVVTNCSERLGRKAAESVAVRFDVVVTSERAGFYKPDPHPYQMALNELDLPASRVLFVAGSGFDLFGTSKVGLDTIWHNQAGLTLPSGAPAPFCESKNIHDVIALANALIR